MSSFTVNGKIVEISEDKMGMSLMDYLREELDLMGTKNGCNIGVCGACTVVIDGSAKRSCKTKMEKVVDKSVLTIEGLEGPNGELHPIQQAFVDCGAIQCGFCTPGMVMSAYALLLKDEKPSRERIRKSLAGNLCRCTGYQQIIDAVETAAQILEDERELAK